MKRCNGRLFPLALAAGAALLAAGCQDEMSSIGGSLTSDQVAIEMDSSFTVKGRTVREPKFDSRSVTNLIGRISVPEYGELDCSFVAQMMPAGAISMPDSLGIERVDSMKLFLRAPRASITGDSLAPQQVSVFELNKRLPQDISNLFDPTGYFNDTPLGKRNFSMSALGSNDSIYTNAVTIDIQVPMPLALARQFVQEYRTNPDVFQWPNTFADYFKGIYVKPTFGRGCVANISAVDMVVYYNYLIERSVLNTTDSIYEMKQVLMRDSSILMSTAPEALNSNNISYTPSKSFEQLVAAGKNVVVGPGGYNVEIEFPVNEVIAKYDMDKHNLAVVNNLVLRIPATSVKNDYSIPMTPYLLMVKTKDLQDFFSNNRLPDNKTSFWAAYSSDNGAYNFTSMRQYLLNAIEAGGYEEEDFTFTLVPVYIATESVTNSNYETETVVTRCTPYIYRPTMTQVDLENAKVIFTYSKQQL